MNEKSPVANIEVDRSNLYKDEVFTDLKMATIRRLSPVKVDGSEDTSRPCVFIGQTHIMSPNGPLPIQAAIEAENLSDAAEAFPKAIEKAVEEIISDAEKQQREEASRIITPGEAGPNLHIK